MARKSTMKRSRSYKKRGMRGGSALMPADAMAPHDIGNFAASQQQAGSTMGQAADTSIINQAGGRSRRQRGGRFELQPTEVAESTGMLSTGPAVQQKGGYFQELLQSAIVPFGLIGLNKYAHAYSGKTPYKGKSRLSKKLRSRRNRR
jgi:hypothetical protein